MPRFFPQSNDKTPALVMTDEDTRECAWCNEEQGKEQGNGSHGICADHSGLLLKKYKLDKAKRKGGHA